MNRQQRRTAAKRRAVEQKYYDELVDRQNHVNAWEVEMNLLCFALAVREAYGWGQQRIAKGMTEFNKQLLRFTQGETLEDLRQELEDKTGIYMRLTDDQVLLRRRVK